jgi:hypothetical protein
VRSRTRKNVKRGTAVCFQSRHNGLRQCSKSDILLPSKKPTDRGTNAASDRQESSGKRVPRRRRAKNGP